MYGDLDGMVNQSQGNHKDQVSVGNSEKMLKTVTG